MATITTSIGTRSAENVDISSVAGAGPYTVTLSGAPSTTSIGDILTDEAASPNTYLITGISGADLTVTDSFGASAAPDASGTTQATTTRAFSTISGWEAVLDDTNLYAASDDAVGECYNDSAFDEAVTINGGGTVGLSSITLTVPVSERHDGTAGTGARIVMSTNNTPITLASNAVVVAIEWLELSANSRAISRIISHTGGSGQSSKLRNLILHDISGNLSSAQAIFSGASRTHDILNSIIYNVTNVATGTQLSIGINTAVNPALNIYNVTIHKITNNNGSGASYGLSNSDDADTTIKNVIVTDTGGTTSGTKQDFAISSPSNATMSYNLSSDTTASGTGSLTEKTSANQFVSTTGGSEDLHLKAGADAIDAGTDLGTTPTGVNIDIDGFDRDADPTYDPWDIGAHELQASIVFIFFPYYVRDLKNSLICR